MRILRIQALFGVMILQVAIASCAGNQRGAAVVLWSDPTGERSLLRVATAEGPMLRGAEVFLVTAEGIELLAVTDGLGVAVLPRHRLAEPDSRALLVCAEHHFCGAFRFDGPGFLQAEDHYISLAPWAIH